MRSTPVEFRFGLRDQEPPWQGACVWVLDQPESSGAVERLIAQRLGIGVEAVVLQKDPHGRPALDLDAMRGNRAAQSLDFSVAHSGSISVIGLCDAGRIGVDVELLQTDLNLDAVSKSFFSAAERAQLDAWAPQDRRLTFFHWWTAKEAFVKAVGLGLGFGLDQVEIARDAEGALQIARVNGSPDLARGWSLVHRRIEAGGAEALAAVVLG